MDQQLRAAQAELANAQASQRIAKITADRWRDLRDPDSVSQQEADEKISSAAVSDAAVQGAQAELQRLRELSRFEKIVAPFDGVITARNTDVGALINSGSSEGAELFRIADMSSLRLYVRVPQNYAAATRVGLDAEVRFPDPGATYSAKLDALRCDRCSQSHAVVQLAVDNAKERTAARRLRGGTSGTADADERRAHPRTHCCSAATGCRSRRFVDQGRHETRHAGSRLWYRSRSSVD